MQGRLSRRKSLFCFVFIFVFISIHMKTITRRRRNFYISFSYLAKQSKNISAAIKKETLAMLSPVRKRNIYRFRVESKISLVFPLLCNIQLPLKKRKKERKKSFLKKKVRNAQELYIKQKL